MVYINFSEEKRYIIILIDTEKSFDSIDLG